MSNSITHQNQFQNQELDAYGSSLRNNSAYPEALGVFPSSIQSRMSLAEGSEMSHTRHLMDLLGADNERSHQTQGLSLSLGSHILVPSDEYRHRPLNQGLMNPNFFMPGQGTREPCNPSVEQQQHITSEYLFASGGTFASSSISLNLSPSNSFGTESFAAVIRNSRYLKPAQSLLQDIVGVGANVIDHRMNVNYVDKLFHGSRTGSRTLSSELKAELRIIGPLLLAEKQEHQMKIAKLISLLDEIESRYEKYCHKMEEVESSFEMIAGIGAARCYTAMALQAISMHFCSLRDAIVSQINVEKRKLSQDLHKINSGLSQISLYDRDNRHSRMPLQQLGIVQTQHQVWRPIRGLPETSVAILRSWLFEHFLHPYPNDSEKLMLTSQTGLTKNQVSPYLKTSNKYFYNTTNPTLILQVYLLLVQLSNWFINARVRLWKPMIEEMYKQEFGESSAENYLTREDTTYYVED
ncbi:putative transcription factor Homeodomain-TALE-BEL family [Lupinus albus]|uniref:Putative transcription factor Homeodomain-TALE-BEL family n=1 Tax=Lupinus albus TaxID=3870 RepID=A0A6A4Q7B5_LUPAL|nr:putative transcription factor Homeodomain-TALE-BEL family [Lupinus albus]